MERRKAPKEIQRDGTLHSTRSAKSGNKKKSTKEVPRDGTLHSTRAQSSSKKKKKVGKKEVVRGK